MNKFKRAYLVDWDNQVAFCIVSSEGLGNITFDKGLSGVLYKYNSWGNDIRPEGVFDVDVNLPSALYQEQEKLSLNNGFVEVEKIADVYIKWDECSHWHFSMRGEDGDNDGYYHICGIGSLNDHIRGLTFAFKVAHDRDLTENIYSDFKNLDLSILDDCKIIYEEI